MEGTATSLGGVSVPKPVRFELARSTLLERLEASRDMRLVALIAPSGYGKTTVLAQYARRLGSRAIWIALREDDATALALAQAVRAALQFSKPELGLARSKEATSAEELNRALALDLEDAPENLTLVLEGADVLGPEAGDWLVAFVQRLSEGHQVLVSGFEVAALPLTRLVAEGQALVLGANDLAFTRDEAVAYLQSRGFEDDPITTFEALEGWPVGIALVASGATPSLAPTDLIADTLARLPEPLRSSLPELAVCEVWSEEAAVRLGCRLPVGWLAQARRAGLPLSLLGRHTYRPLQVLASALELELRQHPLRHSSLHLAAGQAAERDGDALRAMAHYLTAKREDEAVRLAGKVAPTLFERAEYRLLLRTLESLPLPTLPANLQELFGAALLETEDNARGEVVLRQLRAKRAIGGIGLWALGKVALREGQFGRALDLALEALANLPNGSIETARFLRLQGFGLSGLGRHHEALEAGLATLQLAEAHDDLTQLGQALWLVQGEHYHLHNWPECERLIRRGIEVFTAMGQPLRAINLHNDLANLLCLCDRTDEARAVLDTVMPTARTEQRELLPVLYETLADLHLWLGQFERAAELYDTATRHADQFRHINAHRFGLKRAECLWRAGASTEAEAMLKRLRATIPEDATSLSGRADFLEGLMAFDRQAFERAQHHLRGALERSDDLTQTPRALAYLAEVARRAGTLEHHHLERLVASLDAMPSDAVLNTDRAHLTPLWVAAQAHGWFSDRLAALAGESFNASNPEVGTTTRAKPAAHRMRLEIMSLGRLQVSVDGNTIKLPFAKAGELLVWLALHGPANHEAVIDALWDGSGEAKHHEYFRVAVRRLRAALSGGLTFNPLPFERGTYALSNGLEVTLDAEQAQHALETSNDTDAWAALAAYTGDFLPGVDTEWATRTRAQCLEATVTLALTLGERLAATDPKTAVRAYRRAIELDPPNETALLGIIRAHLAAGALAAATQAYTAFVRSLRDEYALEPSPDLRRHLQTLGVTT